MGPVRSSASLLRNGNIPQPGFINQNHRRLLQQLQTHNANEEMVTYDVATSSWVPWTRPVRVLQSGALTAVAASGFHNLSGPDRYEPPICPHAADVTRTSKFSKMELCLRRKHHGKVVDFFQVPRSSHACPFIVVIPPLQPPNILYTQEEIDEHSLFYSAEEEAEMREVALVYDRDFLQEFSSSSSPSKASVSSVDEVDQMLASSSSTESSHFRSSPTASILERRLFPFAPARNNPRLSGYNPRLLPDLTFAEGPSPSPRPISAAGRRVSSFFTAEVANARRNADVDLMSNLHYNEQVGVYEAKPERHPAWDDVATPLTLQPYDARIYPGCTRRTYQNLAFIDTSIGRAIRELNSTLGIPKTTLIALKEIAVKCDACYCMYSPEGYNAHVVDKKCRNSTFYREVHAPHEADIDTIRGLQLRSLASRSELHSIEFDETPIGAAFLEFNSIIGVPADVWTMAITAYVQCKTCRLVRTFPGHREHLDSLGQCHDMGDGIATLDKGKGKEKASSSALVDYDSGENVD